MARRLPLLLLLMMLPFSGRAAEASERAVVFSSVETAEQRAFVDAWLPLLSDETAEAWRSRLEQGQVRWAEIDIDRDGTPERFVMGTAPQDCDRYGCQTYLVRQSGERWWRVDSEHMSEADVAIPDARRGLYHSLRRGTFATFFTLDVGNDVVFRPLVNETERAFAFDWLTSNAKDDERPAFWRKAVDENRIRIATLDLNGDGAAERLLMIADPGWCGSAGCDTVILRPQQGQWVSMGRINMHDTVRVLEEKRNGWHRLNTGTDLLTFGRRGRITEITDLATGEVTR
ncbi:hypothetical protein [Paramagnetospirillum marisnigri]|nr:hypothetical protein [Paramagnetospirillum marisnigri]